MNLEAGAPTVSSHITRTGPEGPIASFELKFFELGHRANGKPFGAMVIVPGAAAAGDAKPHKLTPSEKIFIDAFNECAIVRARKF